MSGLIGQIKACTTCKAMLPHRPNPVFSFHPENKVAVIGQAPGLAVHQSGVHWQDPSGDRLREWLGISKETFYNSKTFAIIPMAFCYPGKGKSGDLPPRPECAPLWHSSIFKELSDIKLRLLVGSYAQNYYLGDLKKGNLTETVRAFKDYMPHNFPLPHPSPRNNIWLKKNTWFEEAVIPKLKDQIQKVLNTQ